MRVLEARTAFLTNYEVARHLESLTSLQDSMLKKGSYSSALESENLRTVQYELTNYLKDQPCQSITPASLRDLLNKLKESDFELTKVEKLMIVNQIPMNEAELSVLLDEYLSRFHEDERENLLRLIESCLGPRLDSTTESPDGDQLGNSQRDAIEDDNAAMPD